MSASSTTSPPSSFRQVDTTGMPPLSPIPVPRTTFQSPPPGPVPSTFPPAPSVRFDESDRAIWTRHFGQQDAVKWVDFEQMLSAHFMQTARVDYRPLAARDLAAIKSRLEQGGVKNRVAYKAFSQFWPWFRLFESSICLMRSEWCKDEPRLIEGLISKQQAEELLRSSQAGTFLLRFSENTPGTIAVAVVEEVDAKLVVRHTLILIREEKFVIPTVGAAQQGAYFSYPTLSAAVLNCKVLNKLYPSVRKEEAFGEEEEDGPH